MAARRDTERSRNAQNQQQYKELARQNREGHQRVERSLKEAARIATRNGRTHSSR